MAKTYLALFVDDIPSDSRDYGKLIKRAWATSFPNTELRISNESDPARAEEELEEHPDRYSVLIVDRYFGMGRSKEEKGTAVLSAGKEYCKHQVRIAITVTDAASWEYAATTAGAHAVLSKQAVSSSPEALLAQKLKEAVRAAEFDVEFSSEVIIEWEERDLRLDAVVQEIGPETLAELASRCLGHACTLVKIHRLRSGLSGALVFRAICKVEGANEPERKILLKVSRSASSLQRERDNYGLTAHFNDLFVESTHEDLHSLGEWSAIAYRFSDNSYTMLEWMQERGAAIAPLKNLFQDLETIYSSAGLEPVPGSIEDATLGILTKARRAKIEEALEDLSGLADRHSQEGLDLEFLRLAIRWNRFGETEAPLKLASFRVAPSHGDLHLRNVLVSRSSKSVRLVDPANISFTQHWAGDIARLTADAYLSGLNSGEDSHEWSTLEAWLDEFKGWLEDVPITVVKGGSRAPHALNFLRHAWAPLSEVCGVEPASRAWEYTLVLGIELLRGGYRVAELSAPKRVFALLAGQFSLKAALELAEAAR